MATERSNFYLITSNSEAGTLETLPPTENLNILSISDLADTDLHFSDGDKVCITSETSLDLLISRITDDSKVNAILNNSIGSSPPKFSEDSFKSFI